MDRKLTVRTTAVAALIALAVAAPVAFAGKGGNGKGGSNAGALSSTLALVMVVDRNADGLPNWNDQVTFDVSSAETDRPWVLLNCYQSGAWVSTTSHGFFSTYLWPNFTLASTAWAGGAADCVATLYVVTSNGNSKDLGSLSFAVDA